MSQKSTNKLLQWFISGNITVHEGIKDNFRKRTALVLRPEGWVSKPSIGTKEMIDIVLMISFSKILKLFTPQNHSHCLVAVYLRIISKLKSVHLYVISVSIQGPDETGCHSVPWHTVGTNHLIPALFTTSLEIILPTALQSVPHKFKPVWELWTFKKLSG